MPSPSAKDLPTASGGFTSSISRSSSTATTASTSKHAYWYIVTVYVISTIGSIFGGSLSGWLMMHAATPSTADANRHALHGDPASCRSFSCRTWDVLFPSNPWPATLIIALATAAHQGWSANLFSTPGDMFPSTAVSTIVGIGGAAGAAGGAAFTWLVKRNLSLHPLLVFSSAACRLPHLARSSSNSSSRAWAVQRKTEPT